MLYLLMFYATCLFLIITASIQVKTKIKTETEMHKTETKLKRRKSVWNGSWNENGKSLQNGNKTETLSDSKNDNENGNKKWKLNHTDLQWPVKKIHNAPEVCISWTGRTQGRERSTKSVTTGTGLSVGNGNGIRASWGCTAAGGPGISSSARIACISLSICFKSFVTAADSISQ